MSELPGYPSRILGGAGQPAEMRGLFEVADHLLFKDFRTGADIVSDEGAFAMLDDKQSRALRMTAFGMFSEQ